MVNRNNRNVQKIAAIAVSHVSLSASRRSMKNRLRTIAWVQATPTLSQTRAGPRVGPRSRNPSRTAMTVSPARTRNTTKLRAGGAGSAWSCSKIVGLCSCMAGPTLYVQMVGRVVPGHVQQRQEEDPHQFDEVPVQAQHLD